MIYQGIRLTPARSWRPPSQEGVDLVGLSVLSGSHLRAVADVLDWTARGRASDIPVVVGGIIPAEDERTLRRSRRGPGLHAEGLRADRVIDELVTVVREAHNLAT